MKKQKLEDYLNSFNLLQSHISFPIGAIVYDSNDEKAVKNIIKENKITMIDSKNKSDDEILKILLESIYNGQICALQYFENFSGRIWNQLTDLIHNQINVELANVKKKIIFKPIERKGKLLILFPDETYSGTSNQLLVSSVCNLQ